MSAKIFPKAVWVILFLLFPAGALADSVSPASYSATLNPGQSVTIPKTVIINKGTPTTAKVDVFFLCDTTGSMGDLIDSVIANANTILDDTAALGDVAFGVGEYKDVGDPFVYRLNQDITKDTSLVKAGLNMWSASGGGDWEEADFFGLYQMANQASWRQNSVRIALWFGDAPSHDPAGPAPGVTEAQTIAALTAKLIKVEALDLGDGGLDAYGQATRIAAATGGAYYATVDPAQIVQVIKDAITQSFVNYHTVSLGTSGLVAGLTVAVNPPNYTGNYDRSIDRTFAFNVTFTAVSPGSYVFSMPVLVDGGAVASEQDNITVGLGLAFPLSGYTPTTAPVSAVMDNSVLERPDPKNRIFYTLLPSGNIVKAFNGETGASQYGVKYMDPWSAYWPAYPNSTGTNFFPAPPGGSRPLNYTTGPDGKYLSYAGNAGYNFPAPAGTQVLATANGKLYKCTDITDPVNGAGYDYYYNSYIDHKNGYYSWFLYTQLTSAIVAEISGKGYADVVRGQVIGNVTTIDATPSRLHFEMRLNGFDHANVVDPYKLGLWQSSQVITGHLEPIINFLLQGATGGIAPVPSAQPDRLPLMFRLPAGAPAAEAPKATSARPIMAPR